MKRSMLSVYLRLRQRQNTLSLTSQGLALLSARKERNGAGGRGHIYARNIFAIKHGSVRFKKENPKRSSEFALSIVNRVTGCDFKDRILF